MNLSIDPCIANDRGRSPVPRWNPLDQRIDYAKINKRRHLTRALLLACGLGLLGCGGSDSGPRRFDVSGAATFDGKPIVNGSISFSPDTSKGNSGPGSFAQIRDGNYETTAGMGPVGGPHVLTIMGLAKLPGSGPPGEIVPPLFSSYRMEVDLPREDTSYDIDVPASAANGNY